jgi:cytochrome c
MKRPTPVRNAAFSLGLAVPAATAMAASVAWADDRSIAYGEYLASECVTCHRLSGQADGIPSIVGWSPDQFLAVMHAYKFKARDNVTMQTITARLSDDELAALAAYFATIKPQ